MKANIKERFLAKLRDPANADRQCSVNIKRGDNCCFVGLFYELAYEDGVIDRIEDSYKDKVTGFLSTCVHGSIIDWAGLENLNHQGLEEYTLGYINKYTNVPEQYWKLNDRRKLTFSQLADVVEENDIYLV